MTHRLPLVPLVLALALGVGCSTTTPAEAGPQEVAAVQLTVEGEVTKIDTPSPVSYTHLTLPTNREV